MMPEPHFWPLRAYFEDTDAGGIVYYANYLRFIERARTEWLRELGVDHAAMLAQENLLFVVRHCIVDYQKSAYLDDELTVKSGILKMGGASMTLQQDVYRGDTLLVACEIVLVCVTSAGEVRRIPASIRAKMES